MNFDHLLDDILDSPNAQELINQAQSALDKEKKARAEFRKWLRPNIKAEYINGAIIMHSPAKRGHLDACGNLYCLLSVYVKKHKLGKTSTEKALIALTRNDYEPDIAFWTAEQAATFTKDTMEHPAPSLIVEVLSKSTKGRDRGIKFQDYAAHGIAEYWIIDPEKEVLEQYILADESDTEYSLLNKLKDKQVLESQAVGGFKIPVAAIFSEEANMIALAEIMRD